MPIQNSPALEAAREAARQPDIPDGEYTARCKEAKFKVLDNGKELLSLVWVIEDEPAKGRHVDQAIWYLTEFGQTQADSIIEKLGRPQTPTPADALNMIEADVPGSVAKIKIKNSESKDGTRVYTNAFVSSFIDAGYYHRW